MHQAADTIWWIKTVILKAASFQHSAAGSALWLVRGGVKEARQISTGVSYMSSGT